MLKNDDITRVLSYLIWEVTNEHYFDLKKAAEERGKILSISHEARVSLIREYHGVFS